LAFAALDAARKVGLAGGFAAAHRDIDNDLKTCYKARPQWAFFCPMSYAHSDIPDAFSDASNTAPQKKKPGSTDKFFNPAGDWPMPNITAEESIYLFATAGSLTSRDGRVTTATRNIDCHTGS
jgi:hypothetical protein